MLGIQIVCCTYSLHGLHESCDIQPSCHPAATWLVPQHTRLPVVCHQQLVAQADLWHTKKRDNTGSLSQSDTAAGMLHVHDIHPEPQHIVSAAAYAWKQRTIPRPPCACRSKTTTAAMTASMGGGGAFTQHQAVRQLKSTSMRAAHLCKCLIALPHHTGLPAKDGSNLGDVHHSLVATHIRKAALVEVPEQPSKHSSHAMGDLNMSAPHVCP